MSKIERIGPKEMADSIIAMYSMDGYVSDFYAKKYALIAIDLILSSHPTKKISSSSIEYDYEYWNEVKNSVL